MTPTKRLTLALLFLHCLLVLPQAVYAANDHNPPRILVDVMPIHQLATDLLAGIAQPERMIDGQQSPHLFQIRPSLAERIQSADLFITVGGNLTPELTRSIGRLNPDAPHIELLAPGIDALPYRGGDEHGHHHTPDPHIWLDPVLMQTVVTKLSEQLATYLPTHADRLAANRNRLITTLEHIDLVMTDRLGAVDRPAYATYHDAYQYLEKRYHLPQSHALLTSPEEVAGTRSSLDAMQQINGQMPPCLLAETNSSKVRRAAEQSGARLILFDPATGRPDKPAETYEQLLLDLADIIRTCAE